ARVDPLADHHPRVGAQPRVELAVADVDRVDAGGAALEQTVRESAGRRPDVEADPPRRIDPEAVEGGGELHAAARDVRMLGAGDGDFRVLVVRLAGLPRGPPVDLDEPREDEGLRLRARRRQAARDEQDVEAGLQNAITTFIEPLAWRARANASGASA